VASCRPSPQKGKRLIFLFQRTDVGWQHKGQRKRQAKPETELSFQFKRAGGVGSNIGLPTEGDEIRIMLRCRSTPQIEVQPSAPPPALRMSLENSLSRLASRVKPAGPLRSFVPARTINRIRSSRLTVYGQRIESRQGKSAK